MPRPICPMFLNHVRYPLGDLGSRYSAVEPGGDARMAQVIERFPGIHLIGRIAAGDLTSDEA